MIWILRIELGWEPAGVSLKFYILESYIILILHNIRTNVSMILVWFGLAWFC